MALVSSVTGSAFGVDFPEAQGTQSVLQTNANVLPASLPAPVNGVITLADATEYRLQSDLNLGLNRIVFGDNTRLVSGTGQRYNVTNTLPGQPLLEMTAGAVISGLSFSSVGAGASFIDATPAAFQAVQRLFIERCEVENFSNVGTISNYAFVYASENIFKLNTGALTFADSIGSVLFLRCQNIFLPGQAVFLQAAPSLIIYGSFNLSSCAFDNQNANAVFSKDPSAVIPVEGFRVNTYCEFGPGNAPFIGVDRNSPESNFSKNVNLEDTYPRAGMTFAGNALATNLAVAGQWYKVNAITQALDLEMFDHSNNTLDYGGVKPRTFLIHAQVSMTGGASREYEFAIAVNNAPLLNFTALDSSEVVGSVDNLSIIAQTRLMPRDTVSLFVREIGGTSSVTVNRGVVILSKIGCA